MIVPVYVSTDGRPENEVMVYALIDSQSDTSFIDESIPNSWEEDFKTVKLEISTVTTQKKIIDCLSMPFCIVTALAFPGETCQSVLETFASSTLASVAGAVVVCGKRFFRF